MLAPGRNNLALALRLITPQTVTLHRYVGRALNAAGQYVAAYAPPETLRNGSLQPVPATRYELLGLDRAKRYVQWWAQAEVFGVRRDHAPDRFEWNGRMYEVTQDTDWFVQDGWVTITGVEIAAGA